jgi:uridine phosphorylase
MGSDRDLGPVGEVDGPAWRTFLGLAPGERPDAVVVEGTWWRADHVRRRLAGLEETRELGVPDVHLGRRGSRWLLYACPYGAPHTAEVVHVAALAGARLAVQLGSCGIVGTGIRPGDVVVPTEALGLDGVTPCYSEDRSSPSSPAWADLAAAALERRGTRVHRGPAVTWPTLFAQPLARVRDWQREGRLGVDMETATTLAVARHFGVPGVSMLVAWDEVLSGRSFLDPLPEAQAAAFARAEEAIFEVALELVGRLATDSPPR